MIDVENLSFGYKRKKLLYKNLSLKLEAGSIYGLLGKNGAGKSTLLKNFIGLLFPTDGNLTVNGFEPKRRNPAFLETIYFIPEEVYVLLVLEDIKTCLRHFIRLLMKTSFTAIWSTWM